MKHITEWVCFIFLDHQVRLAYVIEMTRDAGKSLVNKARHTVALHAGARL